MFLESKTNGAGRLAEALVALAEAADAHPEPITVEQVAELAAEAAKLVNERAADARMSANNAPGFRGNTPPGFHDSRTEEQRAAAHQKIRDELRKKMDDAAEKHRRAAEAAKGK